MFLIRIIYNSGHLLFPGSGLFQFHISSFYIFLLRVRVIGASVSSTRSDFKTRKDKNARIRARIDNFDWLGPKSQHASLDFLYKFGGAVISGHSNFISINNFVCVHCCLFNFILINLGVEHGSYILACI